MALINNKSRREVVLQAVKKNFYELKNACKTLRADREVVTSAIKFDIKRPDYQFGRALKYASADLKLIVKLFLQLLNLKEVSSSMLLRI